MRLVKSPSATALTLASERLQLEASSLEPAAIGRERDPAVVAAIDERPGRLIAGWTLRSRVVRAGRSEGESSHDRRIRSEAADRLDLLAKVKRLGAGARIDHDELPGVSIASGTAWSDADVGDDAAARLRRRPAKKEISPARWLVVIRRIAGRASGNAA